MARRKPKPRRRLLLETFEDRILCSATAPADQDAGTPQVLLEAPIVPAAVAVQAEPDDAPVAAVAATEAEARRELIFVDTGVEDYQWFVDDVLAHKGADTEIEVVLLDAERDGIEQITQTLAGRSELDAIHFVTHGTDRAVKLGATWIDVAALQENRAAIAGWGAALDAEADLLFYGCDLAAAAAGRDLLAAFSSATQADLAANATATGANNRPEAEALSPENVVVPGTAHPLATPSDAVAPATAEKEEAASASVQLTDDQRKAIQDIVRDSTEQIWFEENVGQFADGVRYGFKTAFGAMLVYDDHLRIIARQNDSLTGEQSGVHSVDIAFTGGGIWDFAPGSESGVAGSYQQPGGTSLTPHIFKELTLRNVYDGVDLRLYSADDGVLEFDWIVAHARDYEKIRMQVTGQDGLLFHDDGSATIDLRLEDLTMKMPEVYQVIDGEKHLLGAAMVAGEMPGEIRYRISGDLVPDAPLVIDPNVSWATYFDLNNIGGTFDAYLFAVAVNANGTYAFGYSNTTITNATHPGYMEGSAGFSEGTATSQAYIYRLNNSGTNITAWTSTGIATNNTVSTQTTPEQAADLELFPDGRVLAGFTSGRLQIYSADLATRSYNAEPVTMNALNSLAIVDDNSFYVGGRVSAAIPIAEIPAANIGPDATFAGAHEGVIVRYSDATTTPTADWATYLGGNDSEYFTAVALTPDKTRLVFATTTVVGAAYPGLVNAIDSTLGAAGTTELLVGVLPEQATKPAAFSVFSYLGGSGNEGTIATNTTAAVVTATDSYFYVAGNTVSADLPGVTAASGGVGDGAQTGFGGGTFDAFVSRIALTGSAGGGFQSTYLGGDVEDNIGGIAYDTLADRLLVFGSTRGGTFPVQNTTPASNYYDGTFGGGTWDIFTATLTGTLATKEFASFIGGSSNDYLGQTGDLIGQGHVIYSGATGLTYLATTVHSSNIPASAIGTSPGKDTGKSNGTNDTHVVFAFNLNIFDYGDAPLSYDVSAGSAAREAQLNTLRLGALTDTEANPASGVAATGDDLFDSGTGDDEDALSSIPVLNVGDTSYTITASVLNDTGVARTLSAWVDFNDNGTFEIGEYAAALVSTSALQQNVNLTWASLPALTAGQSYIRLRLSDTALADNAGTPAIDERSIGTGQFGEIEDYALTIGAQPALQVSNVSATEGTDGYAVFSVSLSAVSGSAVSFNLALADLSAIGGGADYGTGGAGDLQVSTDGGASWADATAATIPAGTLSVLVRTPIVDDALDEGVEAFTLTATRTAGNTTNASTLGTATIADDDPAPGISIDDITVNEATGTATFTVTLSTASGQAVSVNYATANGTALAGSDFTSTTGTLNFAAGTLTQTISVPITNDPIFEGSETFNVNLSAATNAMISDSQGVGTIRDDGTGSGGTNDDTPTIAVSSSAVTEGTDSHAVFTVSLSNASTQSISVNLALANVTATGAGTDYGTGGAGNLEVSTDGGTSWADATSATIAAGSASVLVRTPIENDALDENAETFTLTATRTAGTTTNASAAGTATITDNDPTPGFSIDDVTVNEAAGTATFTVSLSAASGLATSVAYTTSNGTATGASDYTSTSGTLNFAAGVVSQTVVVSIANDTTFENSETFNVTLSGAANATIADATGVGTIRDDGTGSGGTDDDTPTLSVSSPTVTEGTDSFAVFTVSLSNASTQATTVNLALANVTATGAGTDYGTGGAGNLQVSTDGGTSWSDATSATIVAGGTSVLVRTPIVNDTLDENAETFTLTATRTAGTTTNASAAGTATITDNDPQPSFSIDDVTVNEAAGTATFTVTLNTASGLATSVAYATSNGTATAGSDFTSTGGTLNFAAGVVSQTVVVSIANDATFENSETFNVDLSAATNATIADNQGVGTIRDDGTGSGGTDNDTPTFAVSSPAVIEGTDSHAVFTVSLSNASTQSTTVNLALANVTATGTGTDYGTAGAGDLQVSTDGGASWADATSVTIAAGNTSVLVRTPIVNDTLDENAEAFTLTATRTAGTTTNASAAGTATISDDDAAPALSIDDVTRNEAAGTMTFTVTLNAASGQVVSVNYATASGTATAGADFTSTSGTLNFAAGATTQTIVVPIVDDATFENNESFTVIVSGAVNATIADNSGTGTILDDGTGGGGTDDDTPTLAVSSPAVTEGTDAHAVFTVSLSNASTQSTTVNLALADGSATGADYGPALEVSTDGGASWNAASSATIAAGSTSVLVRTPITNDVLDEAAETFTLTATRTAGTTTNESAAGTVTITDDDAQPSFSIDDVIVNEAAGTATFTVSLNTASAQVVSVNYATSNGTATVGSDYTSTSGVLNFAVGVTTQTIVVPIFNDATFENSETFDVNLSGAVNATIADALGVGTIRDDGAGSGGTDDDTPTLSVANVSVTEGTDAHAVFAVSLSNPSTQSIVVNLALADGTATATDYGPGLEISTDGGSSWSVGTSVTFLPSVTSVLVRTPISNDALDEPAEAFTLAATRTAGTTTNASALGTATITDNDPTPSLSIDSVTVNEAAGTATFTVTLSAASGQAVSVNYATSDGTATAGGDYTATSSTLNFAPGATTQTIVVPIANDALFEVLEDFTVTLSAPTNATIPAATGTGTIRDDGGGSGGTDDDTPTFNVTNAAVTEGVDPHAVFSVSLSNASTSDITLKLTLADGTATSANDYAGSDPEVSFDGGATWNLSSSATFVAGTTSFLARAAIADDAVSEAIEAFTLDAQLDSGLTANANAFGTATITDNDGTPALSINDVTVNEAAGTATFTVTLSSASALTITADFATVAGTAIAGTDFTAMGGSVTFGPGVLTQSITVPILNDATFEGSESYSVILNNAVNATISDDTGIGTILDDGTGAGGTDNDTPTLAVSSPAVTEGADLHAVFAVSLSNPSTTAVGFNLALANGSGTAADYGPALEVSTDGGATWSTASAGSISAGSTSVLVRTPITDDLLDEPAETFTLTATRTAGTTTNASALGTATIADDDATPSLSIDSVTVNEAAGTATFTVTLSAASGLPVSVGYATSNGTAAAGADYTAASGTLNFAAGVVSQTIVVPITNDAIFENSESFDVMLSAPTNATIATATGTGTILDDGTGSGGTDNDTPTLAVSNVSVTEGTDLHAVFAVTLSNPSNTATTVSLALADGTATGADYGPALEVSTDGGLTWTTGSSVTLAPSATSVLVRSPITNDALDESTENFTLTATRTAGTTTNASATGTATITDDDATPSLTINDVTVNEAAGTLIFTVTLSAPSGLTVNVDFATVDGTALAGADYIATSGTLTFTPGTVTQTITVPILNDTLFENAEGFVLNLSNATNATIADAAGAGTIRDDGTGSGGTDNDTPTLAVGNVSVLEGTDTHAVFTVSLSNPSTQSIAVNLALSDGSATAADYGLGLEVSTDGGATWNAAATATFVPGATSLLARTPLADDAITETPETFTLTATVASGTTTNASTTGTATIVDDEAPPAMSINDVTVNEAAGTATFTVTLNRASTSAIGASFTTGAVTATPSADYIAAAGTVNFAPGEVSQTITVSILDDTIFESSESFDLILSAATNATIADNTGVGTIMDDGTGAGGTDDDTPTLSVSDPTVTEGTHRHAVFTVSLSNASTTPVTLALALADGTATAADYGPALQVSTDGGATWTTAATATIGIGQTSVLVRSPITTDALAEPNENFTLTATVTAGTTTNPAASGTATIVDTPPVPLPPSPPPFVPPSNGFDFQYDTFNNFSDDAPNAEPELLPFQRPVRSIEVDRPALLPLAPIYSGEADPGATLVIDIYNAKGERIGSQTVVADSGGNWLATFPTTTLRDAPNTARITQFAPTYSLNEKWGHNLRTYFTPALNAGHFSLDMHGGADLSGEEAPLLSGLALEDPLQLGAVKYGGEFLTNQATASGR